MQGILSYQLRISDNYFSGVEEVITPTDKPTLEQAQEAVGGYVETMSRIKSPFRSHVTIDAYVNEEGLIIGLPIYFAVMDEYGVRPFAGNIVFIGANDRTGDWVPLTDEEIDFIRDRQRGDNFLLLE